MNKEVIIALLDIDYDKFIDYSFELIKENQLEQIEQYYSINTVFSVALNKLNKKVIIPFQLSKLQQLYYMEL